MGAPKEMANCAGECWAGRGAFPSPGPSAQPDSLVQVPCVNPELNFSAGTAPARPRTITAQLLLLQIRTVMQGRLTLPRIKWPVASRPGIAPQLLALSQTDSLSPPADHKYNINADRGAGGMAGGRMDRWAGN